MYKVVYLTVKRFDGRARTFRRALAAELRRRGVVVMEDVAFDWLNYFRPHRTYGIALAFDFYHDAGRGSGLTLNKTCNYISREIAYSLSNDLDMFMADVPWRDFNFVTSNDRLWFDFFNKVSGNVKAIFHLCTASNAVDWDCYCTNFNGIVTIFADEIVRCLRSDFDARYYRGSVKRAQIGYLKSKTYGVE